MIRLLAMVCAAVAAAGAARADAELCRREAERAEFAHRIPAGLLRAIAVVESGRSHGGTVAAWPWTINADGDGSWHAGRAAAVAELGRLRAAGAESLDVGCMQVSLRFHADAFATDAEAFEPAANVGYAAQFLLALRARHGSWTAALGHYHSATGNLNAGYTRRVLAEWSRAQARAAEVLEDPIDGADASILFTDEEAASLRTALAAAATASDEAPFPPAAMIEAAAEAAAPLPAPAYFLAAILRRGDGWLIRVNDRWLGAGDDLAPLHIAAVTAGAVDFRLPDAAFTLRPNQSFVTATREIVEGRR